MTSQKLIAWKCQESPVWAEISMWIWPVALGYMPPAIWADLTNDSPSKACALICVVIDWKGGLQIPDRFRWMRRGDIVWHAQGIGSHQERGSKYRAGGVGKLDSQLCLNPTLRDF